MQAPVSDDIYREFLKTFQSFRDPAALTTLPLMHNPLVRYTLQNQTELLPHQALQESFTKILDLVAIENSDYADLLRGRFWEGKQIEEMLTAERPLPMSKRTFSNYQRNAIHTFAFLFLQAESNLQRQCATEASATSGEEAPVMFDTAPAANSVPGGSEETSVSVEHQRQESRDVLTLTAPKRRMNWHLGRLLLLVIVLLGVIIGAVGRERLISLVANGMGITPELLFADDFESGDGKWNSDSTDWAIQVDEHGNHFYCVNTTGPYTYALAGNTTWQDYTLQLDLKVVTTASGGSGNILWRVSDTFYPLYLMDFFAEADGNGFELAREDPASITLDQTLSRLPMHTWTPLRIEVKGNAVQIFVGADTLPTLQATDPNPIPQGGIGLGAGFSTGAPTGHWEVCFDNIRVTKK